MKFVSKDLKVENGIVQLVLTISLYGHVLSFPLLSFLCHHCHRLKNLLENNVTCANLDHMAFNGKLPYSSLRGMLSLHFFLPFFIFLLSFSSLEELASAGC